MSHQSNSEFKAPVLKSNLLLVDDRPDNLMALEAVLAGPEYNLILARSGPEAIDLMEKHDIALVLLDVQMPEMDGFETARRMKAIERCRDIPVIFVTAVYREDPFIRKGYEVGAIDYLCKPVDPEILKLKVALYSAFHKKMYLIQERENLLKESAELLETGRKLSRVLATLPVGVIIADAEGLVCQVNEEVVKIFGFTSLVESDSSGEFVRWRDHDGNPFTAAAGPIARLLSSRESSHTELTHIKCFDGTSRPVRISASILRSLDGAITGAVVVIHDVTDYKQIEHDMEQHMQRLNLSKV